MIEQYYLIFELVLMYLFIGFPVSMLVAGDSLGQFPPWVLPIWPVAAVVFVVGELHFAYIQRRDEDV